MKELPFLEGSSQRVKSYALSKYTLTDQEKMYFRRYFLFFLSGICYLDIGQLRLMLQFAYAFSFALLFWRLSKLYFQNPVKSFLLLSCFNFKELFSVLFVILFFMESVFSLVPLRRLRRLTGSFHLPVESPVLLYGLLPPSPLFGLSWSLSFL